MLYGLYQSAQGAQAQTFRIDVIANNLANAGTSGFKRDLAVFQSNRPFDLERGTNADPPGGQLNMSGGVTPAQVVTDYATGPLVHSGGPLDVAVAGSGFFQVSDGQKQYLTRNGQFVVSPTGDLLAAASGMHVLSSTGNPINIPVDAVKVSITPDAGITITGADGSQAQTGKLAVVQPDSTRQLQKIGNNLFSYTGSVAPAGPDTQVQQGFYEASGVQPVSEMVELLQASRAFEANVNMIKFQDDALDRLLQSAGAR